MSTLKIFTDGGSKGNPGPSRVAAVFYQDNKKIHQFHKNIGRATNNDAEYQALILALETIKNHLLTSSYPLERIIFYSDSSLLINQVNGLFKVKHGKIRDYLLKIRILEEEIGIPINYRLIPREKNKEADRLVNLSNNY